MKRSGRLPFREIGKNTLMVVKALLCVRQENISLFRKHAAAPTTPNKRYAELPLQRLDGKAERLLRDAQFSRSGAEGTALHKRQKKCQLFYAQGITLWKD